MKKQNTPPEPPDMFATVDAAAAVESAFANLEAALATESKVLNSSGGAAFQSGRLSEAKQLLKSAGASAKLRERISHFHAERASANVQESISVPVAVILPIPAATSEPRLSVPRAALLAAALPVLRIRKARRSGKISITFADGQVAFDCGDAPFVAPASGTWPGKAVVPAKVVFAWLLDPPDRVDPIELRVADGNFHLHHTRTACHWQSGSR